MMELISRSLAELELGVKGAGGNYRLSRLYRANASDAAGLKSGGSRTYLMNNKIAGARGKGGRRRGEGGERGGEGCSGGERVRYRCNCAATEPETCGSFCRKRETGTNSIAKGKHDELVSRSRFAAASRFRTHNVASERSRVTELFRESYH